MKFANLITQPGSPGSKVVDGLVGRMDGFSYTPDFDSGVFMDKGSSPKLYPQTITVSCTFYVLHTHKLGWRKNAGDKELTSKEGFPHNMNPGTAAFVGVSKTEAGKAAAAGEMSFPFSPLDPDATGTRLPAESTSGADTAADRARVRTE